MAASVWAMAVATACGALCMSAEAAPLKGFRAATGEYSVAFEPGKPWVSISRRGGAGELRWAPGGGSEALPFLQGANLQEVKRTPNRTGVTYTLAGKLGWTRYTVGIALPAGAPGLIRTWLDLADAEPKAAREALGRALPELWYADIADGPADPHAAFYFETPVPHPIKIWHWRRDMNQFVHFGDRRILRSTLLYYADFTAMDAAFQACGTAIYKSVTGWEVHDDIVAQPPGAFGEAGGGPFRFGLQIPAPKQEPTARSFRVSASMLNLEPGAPEVAPTPEPARRFLRGYRRIFAQAPKPEYRFRNWEEIGRTLYRQLGARKDPDWVYWTLATPHFNQLPFIDYVRRYMPEVEAKTLDMAVRQLKPGFAPNYVNDFGSKGGYGWYPTREAAAKVDFWQGYLWPIYILNEHAMAQGDGDLKNASLGLTPVLLDLGRRMDYTWGVFVDLNAARNVETGYDLDYGVAGLYAAVMLQYHRLTGDARYLQEARNAADKLTGFGYGAGFEIQIPALSALTLLRLHKLTGEKRYLDGVDVQLAVIMKHTWLFNPHYGQFAGRDLFGLTSCRANLCYANGAEEGMLMRLLRACLDEGRDRLEPANRQLIADLLRWKAHSWADALAALQPDKSVLFIGQPENWDPVQADSVVPLEPFGYNLDGKKLGFLNECIYGCNLIAEAALMQFHPVGGGRLYTEGPVDLNASDGRWRLRLPVASGPMRVALQAPGLEVRAANGRPAPRDTRPGEPGWTWYLLQPDRSYTVGQATGR